MTRLTTRHGMTMDPTGHHIRWTEGERLFLATCSGYRKEERGGDHYTCTRFVLTTRFFNGEVGPDVPATRVSVLEREFEAAEA